MKKLIFLICFISIAILGNAQSTWQDQAPAVAVDALSTFSSTSDTVAASATVYMSLSAIYGSKMLTISPYALNISGTTGVTYTLEHYVANTWVPLTANNCADLTAANDSITLLTATAGSWTIRSDVNLYRVKCTADGTTQSSIVKVGYMIKEE